ncbi:hypothetical protein JAAARDRAFT_686209 [Jaapia argillacea MUCL 33604]|uniref:Cytochrome P450 n=1 Tax=Jaapia argillacea MUCL 33604 TaxID=933084 RepID=A0A067Q414_9AGAM|nr:hypothetical protein JAAARDRAFT_686209 [Jaapia argillacea MUCL 33604]
MDPPVHPVVILTLASAVSLYFYQKWTHQQRSGGLPYPPGPKPDPVIGNLRQIPKKKQWVTYQQWGKQYGEVIYFAVGGSQIVVLNSARVVNDLLEKRGAIYSDRAQSNMHMEIAQGNITLFPEMKCTEEFNLHRKVVNSALSATASRTYLPCQERETHALLGRLLETPDSYPKHLRRATGSIILTVTYGHKVMTDDDELVKLNEDAIAHIFPTVDPTNFAVNFIPWLKYLPSWAPGAGFKEYARIAREYKTKWADIPFAEVREKMAAGSAEPCYVTNLLAQNGSITNRPDEEDIIKVTAGVLYAAGSDTTVMAIKSFLLGMLLYPDVQEKVHQEIDKVVGSDRLPTWSDMDSLPYFQNCILESMRWKPNAPVGIPHALQRDDVYEGMFLPKDAVVMANVWGIFHDEKMYPDPSRFWPERWDGRFPDAISPRAFGFGYSRRICPGRHMAFNSLLIMLSNIMAVFKIEKKRDVDGREIEPIYDLEELELFMPFIECSITPRSPTAAALVRSSVASSSEA